MKKNVSTKKVAKKHLSTRTVLTIIAIVILVGLTFLMAFMPTRKAGACAVVNSCSAPTPVVVLPKCGVGFSSNPVLTGQQVTLSNTGDRNGTAAFWTVLGSGISGQDVPVSFTEPGTKTIFLTVQWTDKIGSSPCYGSLVVNPAPAATTTLDPTTTVVPTVTVVSTQEPVSNDNHSTTNKVKADGDNSPAINVDGNGNNIYVYAQPSTTATPVPTITPTPSVTPVPNTYNYNFYSYSSTVVNPAPALAPAPVAHMTFWDKLFLPVTNAWRYFIAMWQWRPLIIGNK